MNSQDNNNDSKRLKSTAQLEDELINQSLQINLSNKEPVRDNNNDSKRLKITEQFEDELINQSLQISLSNKERVRTIASNNGQPENIMHFAGLDPNRYVLDTNEQQKIIQKQEREIKALKEKVAYSSQFEKQLMKLASDDGSGELLTNNANVSLQKIKEISNMEKDNNKTNGKKAKKTLNEKGSGLLKVGDYVYKVAEWEVMPEKINL